MNTKHTQGEWKFEMPHFTYHITCNGKSIVQIIPTQEQQEYEANAKLIAAAPDLLVALERLVSRVEENGYHTSFTMAFEKAKSAIKKATE